MEYKRISREEVLQAIVNGYSILYITTLNGNDTMFSFQNLNHLNINEINDIIEFSDNDRSIFIKAKRNG